MTFATLETIDNYDNIDDQFNDQEDDKKKRKLLVDNKICCILKFIFQEVLNLNV